MIIGIAAAKQSGKDLIGDYIVKNYKFVNYHFADPIKLACGHLFGFTEDQMFGPEKEVIDEFWGVTPRRVYQILGTEIFQYDLIKHLPELAYIGRAFWVKRFMKWYNNQQIKPNIIFTDVRFMHEVNLIKEMGGIIWKLERPSIARTDQHVSEVEISQFDNYDDFIINNSTIDDLYLKVDVLLKKYNVNPHIS